MLINPNKLIRSFSFAFDGLRLAVQVDQNVRFHLFVGAIALLLSFIFKIEKYDFFIVLISIFFVVITEMVNTAIEEMTNLIKEEHSREARIAKDVAAGAVFLAALFALIVGIIVFLPHFLNLLQPTT